MTSYHMNIIDKTIYHMNIGTIIEIINLVLYIIIHFIIDFGVIEFNF